MFCIDRFFTISRSKYAVTCSVLLAVWLLALLHGNPAQGARLLAVSVHRGFGCQACHEKAGGGGPADCAKCHGFEADEYDHSIHSKKDHQGRQNATCYDCHGKHHILPISDPRSSVNQSNIVKTCGRCHKDEEKEYEAGIHFEIYKDDPDSAPSCQTCHGYHRIDKVGKYQFIISTTKTCGSCHPGPFESYKESLHGQVLALQGGVSATCWDCHSSHKILEPSDPSSPVSKEKGASACRRCHGNTGPMFMSFWPHASVHDRDGYPILYYSYIMMKWLFILVMLSATVHTLAWMRCFPRMLKARIEKSKGRRYVYYLRFPAWHRLTHFILLVSVLGLAFSGLPLRYSETYWARCIVDLVGGFKDIDLIHRSMAAFLFLAVFLHGYYLLKLVREKGVKGFYRFLLSQDSLFPKIQDFKEAWAEFQCFLRGSPEPERDKWSYWEKFDYWAVFWGMIVIGGSGLMLAFPEVTTRFLPGWALNVALVFHSEEALLAIFFLFIFHFFHSHLRPMKFPVDESIFTGRISEEDYFNERQLEIARKTPEELEEMKVGPPNFFMRLVVYIVSFIAIGIGLSLIACILYTAWKTGRVLP